MVARTAEPPRRHECAPKPGAACPTCKKGRITVGIDRDVTRSVCRVRFIADLPAAQCSACAEVFYAAQVTDAFDLAIADAVLSYGDRSGEALGYARRALRLSEHELALLLDVEPAHVRGWEKERSDIDLPRFVLLRTLVVEEKEGAPRLRLRLLEAREETRPPGPVRIALEVQAAGGGSGSPGSSGKSSPSARTDR